MTELDHGARPRPLPRGAAAQYIRRVTASRSSPSPARLWGVGLAMHAAVETFRAFLPLHTQRTVAGGALLFAHPETESFDGAAIFVDVAGFTALAERCKAMGPDGVEVLSRVLNAAFGSWVTTIDDHGGDVVKFAGDSLVAIWPGVDLDAATRRAAACALQLQAAQLPRVPEADGLTFKVAVDVGTMEFSYVGGVRGRWEPALGGEPLERIGELSDRLRPGSVLVLPHALRRLGSAAQGESAADGGMWLAELAGAPPPEPTVRPHLGLEHLDRLRACVPYAVAARILAGQSGWLAELRRITIVFIQPLGITPRTQLSELHKAVRAVQEALYRFEGSLNKISLDDKGLTLLGAFGLPPLSHEDDPARGALAALAVHSALRAQGVHCQIGVATGRVFCGTVGGNPRREYTVLGAAVNRAARLMQQADGGVLIDAQTARGAEGKVRCEPYGVLHLRGIPDPVAAHRPLGAARAGAGRERVFVGRGPELLQLDGLLAAAQRGKGGLAVLEGGPGLGKSRLLDVVLGRAQALGLPVLGAAGDPVEATTPWFPLRPVLRSLLGLRPGDEGRDPAAVLEAVRPLGELARFGPLLNGVLPLELPETPDTAQMTAEARGDTTVALLVGLVRAQGPVLVVLEDAHWFDSLTWDFAEALVNGAPGALVLLSSRPVPAPAPPPWDRLRARASPLIALEPLNADDTARLLADSLGADAVHPDVLAAVVDRTGGHPFYSAELALELVDSGAVQLRAGVLELTGEEVPLPDSLEGVITSRIDRLPASQQLLLKVGSVLGHVFRADAVRAIHPVEAARDAAQQELLDLEAQHLLSLEGGGEDTRYLFRHALTRQVVYGLMLFSQRAALHASAARWYEERFRDELTPHYGRLAHHWREAALPARAVTYFLRAGEQAWSAYANPEALQYFSEAEALERQLGVEPTPLDAARRDHLVGVAHKRVGELGAARRRLESALTRVGAPPRGRWGLVAELLGAFVAQAWHRLRPGPPPPCPAPRRDALILSARVRYELGQVYWYAGEGERAFHAIMRMLNEAEAAGPSEELGLAWSMALGMCGTMGLRRLSGRYDALARGMLPRIHDPATLGFMKLGIGAGCVLRAQWADALEWFGQSRGHYGQIGAAQTEAGLQPLMTSGYVYLLTGDLPNATTSLGELVQAAVAQRNPGVEVLGRSVLAVARLRSGDLAGAAAEADALVALQPSATLAQELMIGAAAGAHARLQLGDAQGARRLAALATPLARFQPGTPYHVCVGYEHLGAWAARAGGAEGREAHARSLRALRAFARIYPYGEPGARQLAGDRPGAEAAARRLGVRWIDLGA